jgi:hypothetical protein
LDRRVPADFEEQALDPGPARLTIRFSPVRKGRPMEREGIKP